MTHRVRFAAVLLALLFATSPALATGERHDEGSTPLDQVDSAKTRSLDAVDRGGSRALDSVDRGRTRSLDSVDEGGTDSLDSADTGDTQSLDSVDTGRTRSLDAAEAEHGPWQPPSCDRVELTLGAVPAGSDPDAWADRLRAAEREVRSARRALEQADAAYARSLNFNDALGSRRARIVQAREDARTRFSQSRCVLPALVERARRAGVPAGVRRPYRGPPASLDP